MLSKYWIFWFLRQLKQLFNAALEQALIAVYETQPEANDDSGVPVTVGMVTASVYSYVRLYAYAAWLGQVLFNRLQAAKHGVQQTYTPPMAGVSPKWVEQVLREELRIVNGRINAPIGEVASRVNARLGTVISSTARRATLHMVADDNATRADSMLYTLENGHPVGRVLETFYNTETDSLLKPVFDEDTKLQRLLRETLAEFNREYDKTAKPALEITPDMIADFNLLKSGLSELEIEAIGNAWKTAAIAEVELCDDFDVYPSGWYYQWVKNPKTGKVDYIAPPKNKVFEWLKGELGGGGPSQYFTPEDYKRRAIEIIESHSDLWHAEHNLRFARIPTGDYTCGFCLVLASRGAVYKSVDSAILNGFDHENCDCLVVPVYDTDDYPFMEVTREAERIYREHKDLFKPRKSKNTYAYTPRRGKDKGRVVYRHKTYIQVSPVDLARVTRSMPRVDGEAYQRWVDERLEAMRRVA